MIYFTNILNTTAKYAGYSTQKAIFKSKEAENGWTTPREISHLKKFKYLSCNIANKYFNIILHVFLNHSFQIDKLFHIKKQQKPV